MINNKPWAVISWLVILNIDAIAFVTALQCYGYVYRFDNVGDLPATPSGGGTGDPRAKNKVVPAHISNCASGMCCGKYTQYEVKIRDQKLDFEQSAVYAGCMPRKRCVEIEKRKSHQTPDKFPHEKFEKCTYRLCNKFGQINTALRTGLPNVHQKQVRRR